MKFNIGEAVRHLSTKKTGTIVDAWFDGADYRYLVYHSSQFWSIPEYALKCVKKTNKINH